MSARSIAVVSLFLLAVATTGCVSEGQDLVARFINSSERRIQFEVEVFSKAIGSDPPTWDSVGRRNDFVDQGTSNETDLGVREKGAFRFLLTLDNGTFSEHDLEFNRRDGTQAVWHLRTDRIDFAIVVR